MVDGTENGADEDVQVDVVEREADDVKQDVAQGDRSRVSEGCVCGEVLQKVHKEMRGYEMELVEGVPRGTEPNVTRGMRGDDVIGFGGSQYAIDAIRGVTLRDSEASARIVLGEKPRARRCESITSWRS